MLIRAGYDITYQFPQPTPMILALNIHYSRAGDLVRTDNLVTEPSVPTAAYRDGFGNWCTRLVAPPGQLRLRAEALVNDSGLPEPRVTNAFQHDVQSLPEEVLVFLLGSRYCETDQLSNLAWQLFGNTPPGWARVQAICDYVNRHLTFGYAHANSQRTALQAYNERRGVCRDFAHLAIAFCRCMNIPARYCTSYLGDIGVPPVNEPMDFSAFFEAYLGGRWYSFDPRNNTQRIGRILIARGRDAADVAISTAFGEHQLVSFRVITELAN
ncbi:MAG: transglutaminase family protein [Steroidobacteraceae bacterium]